MRSVSPLSKIRFEDHCRFQTTTARLVVGGAVGALAALAGRSLFGWEWAYEMIMGCMGIGIAAGLLREQKRRPLALLVLAPLLGLGALGFLVAAGPSHETFGLATMGALLGWPVCRGLPRLRKALVLGGTAVGVVLGIAVVRALETTALAALDAPDIASYALQGGVVGLFVSLGTLGRHLSIRTDAVADSLATASRELPRDFADLVGRVRETRAHVLDALGRRADGGEKEREAVKKAVDELSDCIVKVGRRWHGVDADLGASNVAVLEQRITELEARIGAAVDDEARRAYEKARSALEDQLQHHREIATSRERTVARLHSYLAVLERLHLAVIRFRSADTHRFAGEMQPMLDELDGVGTDAELAAQAIDESQRGASATAS